MNSIKIENLYKEVYKYAVASSKKEVMDILMQYGSNTIFITEDDFYNVAYGQKIMIDGQVLHVEFLKRILNDELYYQKALEFLNGNEPLFQLGLIKNGKLLSQCSYSKKYLFKGLLHLTDKICNLDLDETGLNRLNELKKSVSFDKVLDKYQLQVFKISIEGNEYSIPVSKMLNIASKSESDFKDLCTNEEIKDIESIPKKYFLYATKVFFEENNLIEDFILPEGIIKNIIALKFSKDIDIQAINQLLTREEYPNNMIPIDSDLEQLILKDMPDELTELEKAIFVYIKMCRVLAYDEEFYACNQQGKVKEKHQNIFYVSKITPENNKIVCYEFDYIYKYLLAKLGIIYQSKYSGDIKHANYGTAHPYLVFRTGKFLIQADAINVIFKSDLSKAKLNQELTGLSCLNFNNLNKKEFLESLEKVYKLIVEQEHNKREENSNNPTLAELLVEYSNSTNNLNHIDLNDKVSILFTKVISLNLETIDSLSYILELYKILFSSYETRNNVCLSIVRENIYENNESKATATCVIAINKYAFTNNPDYNVYYYFNVKTGLKIVTKEEIQNMFNNSTFEYVREDDPKIPGIDEGIKR